MIEDPAVAKKRRLHVDAGCSRLRRHHRHDKKTHAENFYAAPSQPGHPIFIVKDTQEYVRPVFGLADGTDRPTRSPFRHQLSHPHHFPSPRKYEVRAYLQAVVYINLSVQAPPSAANSSPRRDDRVAGNGGGGGTQGHMPPVRSHWRGPFREQMHFPPQGLEKAPICRRWRQRRRRQDWRRVAGGDQTNNAPPP